MGRAVQPNRQVISYTEFWIVEKITAQGEKGSAAGQIGYWLCKVLANSKKITRQGHEGSANGQTGS